jgi:hypothetical protein
MPSTANPPTQPLALSAGYLAMLQTRPAAPQPAPSRQPASATGEQPAPTFSGRGRFVDILV